MVIMVYTVTFNPSIDYIVNVNDFRLGMTNRTDGELFLPGGKGINVSTVLLNLGIDTVALGFTAGFTGAEIESMLKDMKVNTDFIRINKGVSRINFKLKSIDGTEVNGQGPDISEYDIELFMKKLDTIKNGDVLVLAGSIPKSLPDDIYEMILEKMNRKDIFTIVDATGKLLENSLKHKPFLIKPNRSELGEIFNKDIKCTDDIIYYAKKLQERGACNVLVSMGADGAMLVSENGHIYAAAAPEGILKNSVGSGDSMVAGFIAGWIYSGSYEESFKMGVAAGSASAFSEYLAKKDEIEDIYKRVSVLKR